MKGDEWACEAYGREGLEFGARCFFAAPYTRECDSPVMCHDGLVVERDRVFDRIHGLAAEGDPTMQHLAAVFPTPEALLGGSGDLGPSAVDAPPGSGTVGS